MSGVEEQTHGRYKSSAFGKYISLEAKCKKELFLCRDNHATLSTLKDMRSAKVRMSREQIESSIEKRRGNIDR